MKENELQLLDHLRKPKLKGQTVNISIDRYYTDVDGVIVDKSTVPATLQKDFPIYVLGEYDRQGAYQIGQRIAPPDVNTKFLQSFVWGSGANPYFFGFTGLSDIQTKISPGDLVQVYTDNLTAPNYFIFIVQRMTGKSLASFLANTKTEMRDNEIGKVIVEKVQYFTDNFNQWSQGLLVYKNDNIGDVKSDEINPLKFYLPEYEQNKFILMNWRFPVTQYIGFATYMLFATNRITFNLIVKY